MFSSAKILSFQPLLFYRFLIAVAPHISFASILGLSIYLALMRQLRLSEEHFTAYGESPSREFKDIIVL